MPNDNAPAATESEKAHGDAKAKRSFLSRIGLTQYYRISFLEFIDAATNVIFMLVTKFVFMARDVVFCLMGFAHSIVLIPLDFILILTYTALAFIRRNILTRKQKKWAASEDMFDNERANALRKHFKAHSKVNAEDLSNTRKLFWAGNTISIRSMFIRDVSKIHEEEVTSYSPAYSLPLSFPRTRGASSAGLENDLDALCKY